MAQAWRKDKEYGSVEKGKVADFVMVRGEPPKNISDTQNVDAVYRRQEDGYIISS